MYLGQGNGRDEGGKKESMKGRRGRDGEMDLSVIL